MVTDAAKAADDIPMAVFSAITHSNDHDSDIWRNLMGTGLSHFRGIVAESFRDEGRAEGRAEDILRILTVRGVSVPDEARQRVTACTDLAVLDVWFERAITAPTADAVFDES
ncbi:hypothetical protein [Streptomyces cyaneofuscatus]|uniref:hypothetical protein n=1 Tax=Streptomyces cyaneofuscatus TaxID=66883 RepID=UPI0034130E5F